MNGCGDVSKTGGTAQFPVVDERWWPALVWNTPSVTGAMSNKQPFFPRRPELFPDRKWRGVTLIKSQFQVMHAGMRKRRETDVSRTRRRTTNVLIKEHVVIVYLPTYWMRFDLVGKSAGTSTNTLETLRSFRYLLKSIWNHFFDKLLRCGACEYKHFASVWKLLTHHSLRKHTNI